MDFDREATLLKVAIIILVVIGVLSLLIAIYG